MSLRERPEPNDDVVQPTGIDYGKVASLTIQGSLRGVTGGRYDVDQWVARVQKGDMISVSASGFDVSHRVSISYHTGSGWWASSAQVNGYPRPDSQASVELAAPATTSYYVAVSGLRDSAYTLRVRVMPDSVYQIANDGQVETISDRRGSDTIDASGVTTLGITMNLGPGTVSRFSDNKLAFRIDKSTVIENGTGTNQDDVITGSAHANTLDGRAGNDVLKGGSGNDVLIGGAGNDVLNGGTGFDTMTGGSGNDVYYVDHIQDRVVEGSASLASGGSDTVLTSLSAYSLPANVENLRLLARGTANATGNSLDNTLHAGAGNNVLDGRAGNDTASYAFATGAITVSLARTSFQSTGGSGSDRLVGIENLVGSDYNDNLTGNGSANRIDGGAGNDTLNGDLGNDLLKGGLGNDVLIGGAGGDSFWFDTPPDDAANYDQLPDFIAADDTIVLSRAVFSSLGNSGPLDPGSFIGGGGVTTAVDADDHVLYDSGTGSLYYDADGSGTAAAPILLAILATKPTLTNLDFLVA